MLVVYFVIFIATLLGSITGLGGGVIIKPFLAISTDFSVTLTNFYSALAIFSMSLYSIVSNRVSKNKLDYKIIYILVIGAFVGGVIGSKLVLLLLNYLSGQTLIKMQLFILILIMLGSVFITLKSPKKVDVALPVYFTFIIGVISGVISSFLGIGGGIINVPILIFIYKKPHKQAVLSSLVIVFFSQISSILTYIYDGVLQSVEVRDLFLISVVGVIGGVVGKHIFNNLATNIVKILYVLLLTSIIILNIVKII